MGKAVVLGRCERRKDFARGRERNRGFMLVVKRNESKLEGVKASCDGGLGG